MRKVKEILRMKWELGQSNRDIAHSCSISPSTVGEMVRRAKDAGLSWPLPEGLDDGALEAMLYPSAPPATKHRELPDMAYIYKELKRKHVTRFQLWIEYKQNHPDGYSYTQFCEHYRRWCEKVDVAMHQEHRAGEKLFVDWAGDTLPIIDPKTGEEYPGYLFVAVLGASSYTYVEVCAAMDLPAWIGAHCRAFEFFGGVPQIVVPDNTKTGIKHPSLYEPELNPTYQDMATHYGVAVIPARIRKPKDKAKVESGVLVSERAILGGLRNHRLFSVGEANRAVAEQVNWLNTRPMQKIKATRLSLFEEIDRPALRVLPASRYQYAEWKQARVNIDYHIEFDRHFYSVPYQLAREKVDVKATATTVEVFFKGRRVAAHLRAGKSNRYVTEPDHMPAAHRNFLEWKPSRIIAWAQKTGPHTARLLQAIMDSKPHPEQGYRACLGIIRLGEKYPAKRMERAAERALACKALSYTSLKSILDKGLDQVPLRAPQGPPVSDHSNVRGAAYYQETGAM